MGPWLLPPQTSHSRVRPAVGEDRTWEGDNNFLSKSQEPGEAEDRGGTPRLSSGRGMAAGTPVPALLSDFREVHFPLWTCFTIYDGSGLEQMFSSILLNSRAALQLRRLETGCLYLGDTFSSGAQILVVKQTRALPWLWPEVNLI